MILPCGPCVLRPYTVNDIPALARHANDERIARNLRDAFPHPYGEADAARFIAHCQAMSPQTNYAIDVSGEVVGGIGYVLHGDIERCSAEIGYWLGAAFWGRGIVTAALRTLTRHAVETHGLTRVYAVPFSENTASCRVLEKAGFVREGTLRHSAIKLGRVMDQEMYAFVP